jgi:hypothetical protein
MAAQAPPAAPSRRHHRRPCWTLACSGWLHRLRAGASKGTREIPAGWSARLAGPGCGPDRPEFVSLLVGRLAIASTAGGGAHRLVGWPLLPVATALGGGPSTSFGCP